MTIETSNSGELVGNAEIAKRIHRTPERVRQLRDGDPEFPEPIGTLGNRPVWRWAPVRAWAAARGLLVVNPRPGSEYSHQRKLRAECVDCGGPIEFAPSLEIVQGKGAKIVGEWEHRREADVAECPAVAK